MDILESGVIESEDAVIQLMQGRREIIIPDDDDLELTHWWIIRDAGVEQLYLGTPETFNTYVSERNGGVQ